MKKIIFLLFIFTKISAQEIHFPLKASSDKKYLVDQTSKPVFLNGCATWRLPAVTYNEAKTFLIDRKAKKFNAVLIQVSTDTFKNKPDGTPNIANAFLDNDINKPNELYFSHLDSLLKLCDQLNIAVLVAPLYLGCCEDGWLEIIQQYKNSEQKCRSYGEWFANRYKHFPNLVWVSGGDHNPIPEALAFY